MATVFYANGAELATLTNTFKVAGVAADPTTVSLIVTDPDGASVTYTYGGAGTITKSGTGIYTLDVTVSTAGLWVYVWVGTGTASDVVAGAWMVQSTDLRTLYTSLELLKTSLKVESSTTRDPLLLSALTAAARGVDTYTNRRAGGFCPAASATARVYRTWERIVPDPDGERLLIDELGSSTGLVIETSDDNLTWTTVAATEYELSPDNTLADGRPATSVRRIRARWCATARTRVRVTGRWGWPAVPADVSQATLIQAIRLYRRKDSPEGIAGSADWGIIRLSRLDPDVEQLLRDFVLPAAA